MSQIEIDQELADIEKQFGAQAAQAMREIVEIFQTLTKRERRNVLRAIAR